jgi:oligopeptide/dipeptide ABC transporter ATP-binding protein
MMQGKFLHLWIETDDSFEVILDPEQAILVGDNLTRIFAGRGFAKVKAGLRAVDGVTLSLERGKTLALVGESGSGKTTAARMLLGLVAPTSGEVFLDQVPLQKVPRLVRTRRMQMVFQDPSGSFNPRLSVGASVAEPLLVHRWGDRSAIADRVTQLMEMVGLDPAARQRFPHEFSGGQRQRLGIARAIALEPDIIVADEPTSALDVSIRVQILNVLAEIQQRLATTYLLVSHDLGVVRHYSDRIAVMLAGRIVEEGPTATVLTRPAHPYTRQLVDAVSLPRASADRRLVIHDQPPLSGGHTIGCRYRHRCDRAESLCEKEEPTLHCIGSCQAACHFPNVA